MAQIEFAKTRGMFYRGRNGTGYCCGVSVDATWKDTKACNAIYLGPVNSTGDRTASCYFQVPAEKIEELIAAIRAESNIQPVTNQNSVESLMAQYGDWGEHELYIREDWAHETASKNTQRGYWDWVSVRLEVDREMQD